MIRLTGLYKAFGDNVVLGGVDLNVEDGETLALPDAGEVYVDGQSVPLLGRKELAQLRTRIGYVFQFGALFDSMNVFENVKLGITDEDFSNNDDYCRLRVQECLDLVNLTPDTALKFPADLSGGMRKRVGIARAIAGQPKYLLYDEPTSGLDPVNADIIDALVKKLQNELGVTSIVVSHDVRGSFRVGDRVALLADGKIRHVGPPDSFQDSRDPAVRQFLERDFGQ
jgi:phospholipid/cholesterol/gamma-HCH transport system ATP-binding protein